MRTVSLWVLILGTAAAAGCGEDAPGPSEPPAGISKVSGDEQAGEAGRLLDPLVVRVTDARGAGVMRATVNWTVASGTGLFFTDPQGLFVRSVGGTVTDADGIALTYFSPTTTGRATVTAAVVGLPGSGVTFTTDAQAPSWLPLSRSGVVYTRVGVPSSSSLSRYVLYDDATFALQYGEGFEFTGTYAIGSRLLDFGFDTDPRWTARGTVRGDSLLVEYSTEASLSDFEDGRYVRTSDGS